MIKRQMLFFILALGCCSLVGVTTLPWDRAAADPELGAPGEFHVIDIANLRNTVSNYGSFGSIVRPYPSCEWPAGSQNFYLNEGELWVGGVISGQAAVTTGRFSGQEWIPMNGIVLTPSPSAYSDDDAYTRYNDGPSRSDDHIPLGILVSQRTLAWAGADFIVHDMLIENAGSEDLTDVWVGFCWDFNISSHAGGTYGADDLVSFDETDSISYMSDDDGNAGLCPGFIGGYFLNQPLAGHAWWPRGSDPESDAQRYGLLSAGIMKDPAVAGDYRLLQSVGPFDLPVGRKIPILYALGIGDGFSGLQGSLHAAADAVGRATVATGDSTLLEGEEHEISVIIEESKRALGRLQLAVDWEFCDLGLTVVDPQGTEITPEMAVLNPYISYSVEPHRKAYEIINPLPGLWTLRIRYLEGPGQFAYRHTVTVFGLPWDFGSPLEIFQVASAQIFFPLKAAGTPGASYFVCTGQMALKEGAFFNPATDQVSFRMGPYQESIPPGSFYHWGDDTDCDIYLYTNIGPGAWGITLMVLDLSNDRFYVFARHVDMCGTENPVLVRMAIGPETGFEEILMQELSNRWIYPPR